MQTGKHTEQGSFQEFLDQGNVVMPSAEVEREEVSFVRRSVKLTVIGVMLAVVLPNVLQSFCFFGIFGGLMLIWGLWKLWPLNGWFKAAMVASVGLLVVSAVNTVLSGITPTEGHVYVSALLEAELLPGIAGLLTLLPLCVGVAVHEQENILWVILPAVAYVAMFLLGYAGGTDWVLGVKATFAAGVCFSYYKFYKFVP